MHYDDEPRLFNFANETANALLYSHFDGMLLAQNPPPFLIVKTEKREEPVSSIEIEPRGKACSYGDRTDGLPSAKALDTVKTCWHRARGPVIWGLIGFVIGRVAASISLDAKQRL